MKRLVIAALLASACVTVANAQDTIRVGWTIPAEEAKYWMMRRPEKFPNLGKGYKIEWSQFQGTSPMAQALIAGALDCATQGVLPIAQGMTSNTLSTYVVAQHVGENKDSFHLYWAVKDDCPIKKVEDLKGKTVGISIIGGGTHGPFALMLKKHGVDPEKDIKLVEVSFSLSEDALRTGRVDADQHGAAVRGARGSQGRHPQAVRARRGGAEHRAHRGGVPEGFRRQESRAGEAVRQGHHGRTEDGAGQPRRDAEGRERDHQGADSGARHATC